jgi:type IV pilus assembly protein PilE
MVVVAIIAILAAIALPSYRRYVVRTNRTEATTALTDLAAREERFYYSKNVYTDDLTDLNGSSTMNTKNYTFDIVASAATVAPATYDITATPVGNQATDDRDCQSISLNQAGQWASTGATADNPACWGNK